MARSWTGDAEKTLEAIVAAQDWAPALPWATHDLEIAAAGELLGEGSERPEFRPSVLTLYMDMLERAIKAIKQGKAARMEHATGGAGLSICACGTDTLRLLARMYTAG